MNSPKIKFSNSDNLDKFVDKFSSHCSDWIDFASDLLFHIDNSDHHHARIIDVYYGDSLEKIISDFKAAHLICISSNPLPSMSIIRSIRDKEFELLYMLCLPMHKQRAFAHWRQIQKPLDEAQRLYGKLGSLMDQSQYKLSTASLNLIQAKQRQVTEIWPNLQRKSKIKYNMLFNKSNNAWLKSVLHKGRSLFGLTMTDWDLVLVDNIESQWGGSEFIHNGASIAPLYNKRNNSDVVFYKIYCSSQLNKSVLRTTLFLLITYRLMDNPKFARSRLSSFRDLVVQASRLLEEIYS